MAPIVVTRSISAPLEQVFKTVADIREFSQAIPHIENVEFLTEQKTGVGTRFRETRTMKGKQMQTELEVTEYTQDDRIRMVADSNGTVWDTVFTVAAKEQGTELVMTMEAKPYTLMARLTTPLISGMVAKAVETDMDSVKDFCERSAAG